MAQEPLRARDLVRGPRRRHPKPPDTGRQHHLGGAPADMPVLGEGRTTRTTAVQLADRTVHELEVLATAIGTEMTAAAAALDFEAAAWHRDELGRVEAALAGRR
jgi:hypothetical protein